MIIRNDISLEDYPEKIERLNVKRQMARSESSSHESIMSSKTQNSVAKAKPMAGFSAEIQSVVVNQQYIKGHTADGFPLYEDEDDITRGDHIIAIHKRVNSTWIELNTAQDRELFHRLINATTPLNNNYSYTDSWWFDPIDDSDELRFINVALIEDAGPEIIADFQALGRSPTDAFHLFITELFPNEGDIRLQDCTTFAQRLWRLLKLKAMINDKAEINFKVKSGEHIPKHIVNCHLKMMEITLPTIRSTYRLVLGGHRYAAKRMLGWTTFELKIASFLDLDFEEVSPDDRSEVDLHAQYLFDKTQSNAAMVLDHWGEVLSDDETKGKNDEDSNSVQVVSQRRPEVGIDVHGLAGYFEQLEHHVHRFPYSLTVDKSQNNTPTFISNEKIGKGKVVVDDSLFIEQSTSINGLVNTNRYVKNHTTAELKDPSQLKYMVNHLCFYQLDNKEWAQGYLMDVSPVQWDNNLFNNVVMAEERKRIIRAVLTQKPSELDLVANKGNNTVFLFTGQPGTGKTLTAEASAHLLRCPLIKVSFADLGTNVADVEKRMRGFMNMAHRWNAAILLDEADVFLEARDNQNLERTALVACFLHLLEYYRGTLFMTTNREDTIDNAILSRISLNLHFDINNIETRKIWTQILERVEHDSLSDAQLSMLVDLNLDGRAIRRTIDLAHRLARHEKHRLGFDDIDVAARIMSEH